MTLRKVVLVGAGGMGKVWGANLRDCEATQVVGWVDINRAAAASAVEDLKLKDAVAGDDLGAALATLKPDFVVDVTVPQAHHQVTIQALQAGVAVLGEKPMADSMQHAREMVRASEQSGALYMVSQNRRYSVQIATFQNLVRNHIGGAGILNSDFYIGAHFGGFRDRMPSPLILDMAIHTFDQARFITGADPLSVFCEEFNPSWSWFDGDASASALFTMSGGLRYTYRGSWCAEGLHTSWESEWRAAGSKGSAKWNGGDEIVAEAVTRSGGFHSEVERLTPEPVSMPHTDIAASLRDFLNALDSGQTPMGECHDNIKSLAMVFGCVESSKRGQRVSIAEILQS